MGTAVQRNDSRFMDHLLKDCHESRSLHDLLSVAIDHRKYGSGHAACDATNVVAEIFPRRRHRIIVAGSFRNSPRSRFRLDIRSSAVGRIDYQRGLPAWSSGTLAPVTRGARTDASIRAHKFLLVVVGLTRKSRLSLCQFLFGVIEPVAELGRPIKGRADTVITRPRAL